MSQIRFSISIIPSAFFLIPSLIRYEPKRSFPVRMSLAATATYHLVTVLTHRYLYDHPRKQETITVRQLDFSNGLLRCF